MKRNIGYLIDWFTWDHVRRSIYVIFLLVLIFSGTKTILFMGSVPDTIRAAEKRQIAAQAKLDDVERQLKTVDGLKYKGSNTQLYTASIIGANIADAQNSLFSNPLAAIEGSSYSWLSSVDEKSLDAVKKPWLSVYKDHVPLVADIDKLVGWRFASMTQYDTDKFKIIWVCQTAKEKAFDIMQADSADMRSVNSIIGYVTADYDARSDKLSNVSVHTMKDWESQVRKVATE